MITDSQLFMACNIVGAGLMMLVIFYHYFVQVEPKNDNKERVKVTAPIKQPMDGMQKKKERKVHKRG